MKLAKKYKLIVIEDCAQSHGAKYRGRYVGSIGHLGAFSLMAGKYMTSAGRGGDGDYQQRETLLERQKIRR